MVNKLLKDIHSNQIGIIVIARFGAGWKINSDSPKDDSAEFMEDASAIGIYQTAMS